MTVHVFENRLDRNQPWSKDVTHLNRLYVIYDHEHDDKYCRKLQSELTSVCVSADALLSDTINKDTAGHLKEIFMKDISVSLVLIGRNTFESPRVDLELYASLLDVDEIPPAGLLGIVLPDCPGFKHSSNWSEQFLPTRFKENYFSGYAGLINWPENLQTILDEAERARVRKSIISPRNQQELLCSGSGISYNSFPHYL